MIILTPGYDNKINDKYKLLEKFSIWNPDVVHQDEDDTFSFLRFINETPNQASVHAKQDIITNAIDLQSYTGKSNSELVERFTTVYGKPNTNKMLIINESDVSISHSAAHGLLSVQDNVYKDMYLNTTHLGAFASVSAPPIGISCSKKSFNFVKHDAMFDSKLRSALFPMTLNNELTFLKAKTPLENWPKSNLLPEPLNKVNGHSSIRLPSMKRFVIESGKLAKLDQMLVELKKNDHKCLIYFQMTRMMDLMEEYLQYRQYKYIRLDGSSRLELVVWVSI
ncbi:unnamed protein product [Ambrosiozyma monospora]|uniref:Chromatin-remodeling ATPase INO80 n=1 Tax=Ambrosiozyma monospora TaxID=43982 RepID=A0A9W6T7A7_AMBMO|nr:unnamed protein product [Ambrosiozyma monospora]